MLGADENPSSTTGAKRPEKGHPEGGREAMPLTGTNPGQPAISKLNRTDTVLLADFEGGVCTTLSLSGSC
jgi:hypothetical protein